MASKSQRKENWTELFSVHTKWPLEAAEEIQINQKLETSTIAIRLHTRTEMLCHTVLLQIMQKFLARGEWLSAKYMYHHK